MSSQKFKAAAAAATSQEFQVMADPSWLSSGLLVYDRGFPQVKWATFIMVGNHKMYKRATDYPGGYPYLLAKRWRKEVKYSGSTLEHQGIKVPGMPNMWWVPPHTAARYLRDLDKIWDGFMAEVLDVAANPKRYHSLREAHRKWHLMPWIRRQMRENYPIHDSLVSLGFPEDREAMMEQLSHQCLLNYPTPQQLIDGVASSRPAAWVADVAASAAVAGRYSMWTPWRCRQIAVAAADKYYWMVYISLRRVARWMTPSPKTGRYNPLLPLGTIRKMKERLARLRDWEGPGNDHVLHEAVTTLASDILAAAGPRLSAIHPSNPLRRHFLVRLNFLLLHSSSRQYKADKVKWWLSGRQEDRPLIPVPPKVPVSAHI